MPLAVSTVIPFDVQLTTTSLPLFTNPQQQPSILVTVTADNTDSSSPHSIWIFRNNGGGGNDTSANQIIGNMSIPANLTVVLPLSGQALLQNESLDGYADSGNIVTVSGTVALLG
jgi:hypothetical protein